MKIPERYKTLLTNTGLLFVGTFGSKMISFVMLPFYTAWLSIEDFGTSDVINVYSTILVAVASLCIAEAVFVIPTGRNKEDQKKFFSSSQFFGLICAIFLALLFIAIRLLGGIFTSSFFTNIGYITLLCGTTIFMSIAQQFCKCINMIKVFAFAGVINTLIVAALGFVLIRPFGLLGYVASLVIANLMALVYVFLRARLSDYISITAISKNHLVELLKYSVPLIPNSIIWLIVSYINRPVMEAYMGMAAIGLYSLANRFPTLISTLYNNFSNSWQISVLQEYGKQGYERFYNRTCISVFVGLCLCVSLLSIIISPLIQLLFGKDYYPAISYIPWLCLSTPFMALASIVGANFSAIKQSKYFFYSSIWSAGSAVVFNLTLIPTVGLWGACISSVLSFVIGAVSRIYYARDIVRFRWGGGYILLSLTLVLSLALNHFLDNVMSSCIFLFVLMLIILLCFKKFYSNNSSH